MMSVLTIASIAGNFTTNPYLWALTRFVCGGTAIGYITIGRIYRLELTSGKWKSRSSHYFGLMPWAVGHVSVGLLVYLIPNMLNYELIVGISFLSSLPMWYFMPESPRWLLEKGKLDEAKATLKVASKMNKKPLDPIDNLEVPKQITKEKTHMHHLLKHPGVRRNTMIMCFVWFAFAMGYYGLAYNTPPFEANIYLVFVVPALISFPSGVFQPLIENKVGRKAVMTGLLLTNGILLLTTSVLPQGETDSKWPIIVCCWIGQLCCTLLFTLGYTFTQELFPTLYRTTAISTVSTCARVGILLSPSIGMLDEFFPIAPLLVYGSVTLLAGVLSIWIWPETVHQKSFPKTLEEADTRASTTNVWVSFKKRNFSGRKSPNLSVE